MQYAKQGNIFNEVKYQLAKTQLKYTLHNYQGRALKCLPDIHEAEEYWVF